MQTIGRTSIGTARKDDNRIDQAGGTIRCDKRDEVRSCMPTRLSRPCLGVSLRVLCTAVHSMGS